MQIMGRSEGRAQWMKKTTGPALGSGWAVDGKGGVWRLGETGTEAGPENCQGLCRSYIFPGGSDVKESACMGWEETPVWSLGQEDPLEKETATHSSILAWRIPWTEEPGGLQSMGSQRVEHDWAINIL